MRDDGGTHTSGTFSGTNITISYDSATEKLTLSGYDTIANYNTRARRRLRVQRRPATTRPTTGNNATRTVTWTVSDGALGRPDTAR